MRFSLIKKGYTGPVGVRTGRRSPSEEPVIVLGLVLLLIGLLIGPPILTTIGIILLVVGLILNLVPIGGTRRRVF